MWILFTGGAKSRVQLLREFLEGILESEGIRARRSYGFLKKCGIGKGGFVLILGNRIRWNPRNGDYNGQHISMKKGGIYENQNTISWRG